MPMPGPIGLMMRQKAGRRPPMPMGPGGPDDMDGMMFPGGDEDMDMNAQQGTVPMPFQPQAPMDQGMAMPVHDTGQVQGQYKRMGMKPTPQVNALTQGMEQSPPGPIKEKFHAAQHQRMLGDQNSVNQQLRMDLANKKAMIEQKILQMQREGNFDGAARMQRSYEAMMGQLDQVMSNQGMQP